MVCPSCNTESQWEANFCPHCGQKLASVHVPAEETAAVTNTQAIKSALTAVALGGLLLGGWMLKNYLDRSFTVQEEEEVLPEPEQVCMPPRYQFMGKTSEDIEPVAFTPEKQLSVESVLGELERSPSRGIPQERAPAHYPIPPQPSAPSPIAQKWHEANTAIQQQKNAAYQKYQQHQSYMQQQQRYTDRHYERLRDSYRRY